MARRMTGFIDQPRFDHASWGIKIVSLNSGKILFERNAGKLFQSASNAKLFTGALALDSFGPDDRIRTSCYARSRPDGEGILHGDLLVYGRGDFSMAARFHDGDYSQSLTPLTDAIIAAGIKRIEGDLIGDTSLFQGPPFGNNWAWDDLQYYYGAEVSALTVDDNVVDLVFRPGGQVGDLCSIHPFPPALTLTFINRTRTVPEGGPRSIRLYRPIGENVVYADGTLPVGGMDFKDSVSAGNPAKWFLGLLKMELESRGVRVSGGTRTRGWLDPPLAYNSSDEWNELCHAQSRPMKELVRVMMKSSQNLYAQLLLLRAGALRTDHGQFATTEAAGLAALGDFLDQAGISRREVLLDEGSGLSRKCLVSPNAIVQLLVHMNTHPQAAVFKDSLPVAGVDGTLRERFLGTLAEGNLRAKTGAMQYVETLSGYAAGAGGEPLVFSLILNQYQPPDEEHSAQNDIDRLALIMIQALEK